MQSRRWLARPRNLSSEGIHSDEAAKERGFAGGLVPGVTLYQHVVEELLAQGHDWLREGSAEFRFRRPVYDAEEVAFTIDADDGTFTVASPEEGGELRTLGKLGFGPAPRVRMEQRPAAITRAPLGDPQQIGVPLALQVVADPERARAALDVGYRTHEEGGRPVYPLGLWLNPVDLIRAHFDAPVTIHSWGRVWHHTPVYVGETITKRGFITGFEERNGNRIVAFTAVVAGEDGRPVATIEHKSVYGLSG